jgi:hypothetical protein
MLSVIILNVTVPNSCYADCPILFIVTMSVVMLSVIMMNVIVLSGIMMNVVILSVVAPSIKIVGN